MASDNGKQPKFRDNLSLASKVNLQSQVHLYPNSENNYRKPAGYNKLSKIYRDCDGGFSAWFGFLVIIPKQNIFISAKKDGKIRAFEPDVNNKAVQCSDQGIAQLIQTIRPHCFKLSDPIKTNLQLFIFFLLAGASPRKSHNSVRELMMQAVEAAISKLKELDCNGDYKIELLDEYMKMILCIVYSEKCTVTVVNSLYETLLVWPKIDLVENLNDLALIRDAQSSGGVAFNLGNDLKLSAPESQQNTVYLGAKEAGMVDLATLIILCLDRVPSISLATKSFIDRTSLLLWLLGYLVKQHNCPHLHRTLKIILDEKFLGAVVTQETLSEHVDSQRLKLQANLNFSKFLSDKNASPCSLVFKSSQSIPCLLLDCAATAIYNEAKNGQFPAKTKNSLQLIDASLIFVTQFLSMFCSK
ncbi:hypothetical protein Ciccas_010838 [Cichlidogyrus casuarinus]|uniref:Uncharacterized protein n=1 Tax=Cichlidogyrus casuarinus TaxID=1844966 RepID=A0ABD2PTD1_9PLAT